MKKIVLILAAMTVMASPFAFTAPETKTFESAKIKSMDISNGSGDVSIGVSAGPTTVTYEKVKFNEKCEFSIDVVGSELVIKTKDSSFFGSQECQVNVNVSGPKNVGIKLKNGSGDIQIKDTHGAVEYKIGSGDVNIHAKVTELHGKSGSGDLVAIGLSGNAQIDSGSGEMKLTYNKCPNKGKIDIHSGSGDAIVNLPADSTVTTSFKAGSGELKNDFGTSENPKLSISMKAGSGSLSIKRK